MNEPLSPFADKTRTISAETHHHAVDFNIFEVINAFILRLVMTIAP